VILITPATGSNQNPQILATAQELSGSFGWEFANAKSADIIDLATAYMAGMVRNHPFVDGNKRTGIAGTARLTTSWRISNATARISCCFSVFLSIANRPETREYPDGGHARMARPNEHHLPVCL
jgi:Fic/DOC family